MCVIQNHSKVCPPPPHIYTEAKEVAACAPDMYNIIIVNLLLISGTCTCI